MATTKIFVNLPVKDLNKTMVFFGKLGFKFNPDFTDKSAACMIISKDIYAMLLTEKFFKTFIKKKISDSTKNTEMILSLTANSRKEVDSMMRKVISAGGKETREATDMPGMYGRSFQDINGHQWEIFFMDEKVLKKEMKKQKEKLAAK
jgi:predicted lactoylglutathione lyase